MNFKIQKRIKIALKIVLVSGLIIIAAATIIVTKNNFPPNHAENCHNQGGHVIYRGIEKHTHSTGKAAYSHEHYLYDCLRNDVIINSWEGNKP